MEYEYLETLAKAFIIPAKQNQIIQENIINKAPVRRTAIAMNTKSALTESYTEKSFWYHHFGPAQVRILREVQPIVNFEDADIFCLYVTTMKAMNFQDNISSIPIDHFNDHCVLVVSLT